MRERKLHSTKEELGYVYGHVSKTRKRKMIERMGKLLSSTTNPVVY
jgi:hypothetical protein